MRSKLWIIFFLPRFKNVLLTFFFMGQCESAKIVSKNKDRNIWEKITLYRQPIKNLLNILTNEHMTSISAKEIEIT